MSWRSGSSPRGRGKLNLETVTDEAVVAHPRVGGENTLDGLVVDLATGSSPLTRGKLISLTPTVGRRGLIPAHAGKTVSVRITMSPFPAHPRSRGENRARMSRAAPTGGSSPLTRGKPRTRHTQHVPRGLIPAHAGKTLRRPLAARVTAAHPRSRGENNGLSSVAGYVNGSSPLTRGKHRHRLD